MREDNEAACRVIQAGRNPTMMHLHRVHGVSIASLHEICGRGRPSPDVDVVYTSIDEVQADMFTNVSTTTSRFMSVLNSTYIVKQSNHDASSKRARFMITTRVALQCSPTHMANPKEGNYTHGKPPPPIVGELLARTTTRSVVQFAPRTTTPPPRQPIVSLLPPPPWSGPTPISASALATATVTSINNTDLAMMGSGYNFSPKACCSKAHHRNAW